MKIIRFSNRNIVMNHIEEVSIGMLIVTLYLTSGRIVEHKYKNHEEAREFGEQIIEWIKDVK